MTPAQQLAMAVVLLAGAGLTLLVEDVRVRGRSVPTLAIGVLLLAVVMVAASKGVAS